MGVRIGSRLVWRVTAPIAAAAFLIGASVALNSGPAQAKKCISEATDMPCKKCHTDAKGGKDDLNAYGQKYKAKGNFPC